MTRTTQDTDGRPLAVITPTDKPGVDLYEPTRWHGDRKMSSIDEMFGGSDDPADLHQAVADVRALNQALGKLGLPLAIPLAALEAAYNVLNDGAHVEMDRVVAALNAALPHLIPPGHVVGQHSDDIAVDRFAVAMKQKLALARSKGRGGWDDPTQCPPERLAAMLVDHVSKGDPVDVGNFSMMLFHRNGGRFMRAAVVPPPGHVVVPVVPTIEMMDAGDVVYCTDAPVEDIYRAMVAASQGGGND